MDQFTQRTEAFVQWFRARGGRMSPKVELADFRDKGMGRGLRVSQDSVDISEELFSVPASLFLHSDMAPEIKLLAEEHELDEWSALIVTMMALQTQDDWAPYFDILPTQFDTPMFWDERETTELLRPSGVLDRIGRDAADELYNKLLKGILQKRPFTNLPSECTSREAFHRFGSIIMAYAFDVPKGSLETRPSGSDEYGEDKQDHENEEDDDEYEAPTIKALIPLADMVNESAGSSNVEFKQVDLSVGLTCLSSVALQAGQQAFLSRTSVSSSEMLRRFGYVDNEDETFEAVDISLELVKTCASTSLDEQDVATKLERLEEYMGELPETLEPSVVDDNGDVQLNYDDDLLLIVAALTAPEVKRKYLKSVVDDFVEHESMAADAKRLLQDVLITRRREYGTVAKPSAVNMRRDMAQYVLWSETRALERLVAGLDSIKEGVPPAPKRAKSS